MSVARILIGITSCRKHKERRDACRATWMSKPVDGIRPVFFVGGGVPLPDEPDTITLDCPDTYEALPAKIRAFFDHALQHESFDWLFKCDDDTYVAQNRLHDLTVGNHELAGNAEFLDTKGYASGGAGYLLSRRMVAILAGDRSLPGVGCEDIIMTKAALRHGATALPSPRLVWTVAPAPRPDNDLITCHWCDPRKMTVVHAGLTDEVHGRFHVTHRHWQDQLYLYKKGIFRRAATGCAGNWQVDAAGALHLHWFDWESEIVQPYRAGYQSEVMRMVPALESDGTSPRQRTLVVHLMGGIGNQMFQYAHGLALARQTKAQLQLAHPSRGHPFALHHFGLSPATDVPEDIPVITDESGYKPGLEVKVRRAVEIAMNPVAAVRGYFQNEQCFASVKDEIRQQFRPPPKLLPEYGDRTPVCVNVRRGELVNHHLHDVCAPAYYETARKIISSLVDNPCFVVVADNLDWCKQAMRTWPDTIFYHPENVHDAFAVMCACQAFIIPNSTFGWWAAWLSGSQIVIRPDRFLNKRPWDIGPDHWIRVPGAGLGQKSSSPQVIETSALPSGAAERHESDEKSPGLRLTPACRVFAYRSGGNLGDTIQTLALAGLLPGPLEGVYRDAADYLTPDGPPFVVNGYLCESTPRLSDCLFAGVYIGGRSSEQFEWIRQSRHAVGARDPATVRALKKAGIESEMIGCATLTLPKYTGQRSGCVRIDDLSADCELTQSHDNLPWHSQYACASQRLDLLRTAELVVTTRLHVVLPCLAFGTPVMFPSAARNKIFQRDRLSLLDDLGFEYDKPNVIDVSEHARRYLAFLEHNLKIPLTLSHHPEVPDPFSWSMRSPQ